MKKHERQLDRWTNRAVAGLAATAVLVSGCGKKSRSDWLASPVNSPELAGEAPKGVLSPETPKVEILFVVDNSTSMNVHIANLSANIDQFVSGLGDNFPFPYNLAVTTVADSTNKGWAGAGHFVPVKSSETDVVPNKYSISSDDPNRAELMRHTLKVGTLSPDKGGPEVEELFSPVARIYGLNFGFDENPLPPPLENEVAARQRPFFFGPTSHKVLFFISDAADNSLVTATQLFNGLVEMSGGDPQRVIAFGASVPDRGSGNCKADPGLKEGRKLSQLLKLSKVSPSVNNTLNLCSANFGERLAQFGSEIRKKTISQFIPLTQGLPDFTGGPNSTNLEKNQGIWVTYGASKDLTQRQRLLMQLPGEKTVGYRYQVNPLGIYLNPKFKFKVEPGAYLDIRYVPITIANQRRDRVTPWSPSSDRDADGSGAEAAVAGGTTKKVQSKKANRNRTTSEKGS
jgi:hypothetical protein